MLRAYKNSSCTVRSDLSCKEKMASEGRLPSLQYAKWECKNSTLFVSSLKTSPPERSLEQILSPEHRYEQNFKVKDCYTLLYGYAECCLNVVSYPHELVTL